jgi:hypothetical protein
MRSVPTSNLSLIRHLPDVLLRKQMLKEEARSNSQLANHFKFGYYSLESYICLGLCLATLHNAGAAARGSAMTGSIRGHNWTAYRLGTQFG